MTEIDLTPVTRLEYDIDAILNDHAVAEPITRIELILADIVAGNTTTVEPVTRIETYLAIISGADYPVPEPVTRIETFLAIIAGEDYETPEAVTRLEGLLAEWVEKGSGIWKTVTGALIHITDAIASPMQKCEVTLEPIQSGSGDPSPTNVRPITGWTGCEVTRAGLNICVVKNLYIGGVSGLAIGNDGVLACFNGINGQTYRISGLSGDRNILYKFRGKMDDIKSGASMSVAIGSPSLPYVFTADETCIYCFYRNSTWSESIANSMKVTIGDSASDYEAPNITTLSVTFPDGQTVYGGTVDLVSGVLVADKVVITDFANLYIAYNTEIGIIRSFYVRIPNNITRKADTFVQSSLFKSQPLAGTHAYDCEVTTLSGLGDRIYFSISNIDYPGMTAVQAQQFLIDNSVQFLINLATPITYQLTPRQISTLKGENNVWSNANGETTLIYKAQAE